MYSKGSGLCVFPFAMQNGNPGCFHWMDFRQRSTSRLIIKIIPGDFNTLTDRLISKERILLECERLNSHSTGYG
jgi:hypothetical protein